MSILLAPPFVFIIYFIVSYILSRSAQFISAKGKNEPGKEENYACGEDVGECKVQPDYSEFFPFAFFFTIMHVIALIIAMVPSDVTLLPIIYLVVALVSVSILFRRE
jgi:NADH-quinone oxidoreductase subunit A